MLGDTYGPFLLAISPSSLPAVSVTVCVPGMAQALGLRDEYFMVPALRGLPSFQGNRWEPSVQVASTTIHTRVCSGL